MDEDGHYIGTGNCRHEYGKTYKPKVPYGNTESEGLYFEDGYKEVVGYLTEGRHLVFEANGKALTNGGQGLTEKEASPKHDAKEQRWTIHYSGHEESGEFTMSSRLDGKWLAANGNLVQEKERAAPVKFQFLGNGKGYTIQYAQSNSFVNLGNGNDGKVAFEQTRKTQFSIFSVTYHD